MNTVAEPIRERSTARKAASRPAGRGATKPAGPPDVRIAEPPVAGLQAAFEAVRDAPAHPIDGLDYSWETREEGLDVLRRIAAEYVFWAEQKGLTDGLREKLGESREDRDWQNSPDFQIEEARVLFLRDTACWQQTRLERLLIDVFGALRPDAPEPVRLGPDGYPFNIHHVRVGDFTVVVYPNQDPFMLDHRVDPD